MAELMAEFDNGSKDVAEEKRKGERRGADRRCSNGSGSYSGPEKRVADNDRRITIINRMRTEVTDRRSYN